MSKIGIIAGSGDLPVQVICHLKAQGRPYCVVGFYDQTPDDLAALTPPENSACFYLGQVGAVMNFFAAQGVTDVVMIGGINRPSWDALRLDGQALKLLSKFMLRGGTKGDDALLKLLIRHMESHGLRLIGVQDILPTIMQTSSLTTNRCPTPQELDDIRYGWRLLETMAPLDIGQSIAVQQGLVLAVEAIEGTDAMLHRSGQLKRSGSGPVLIKCPKIGQDMRADAPTLGKATIRMAHEAGFAGIAYLRGAVLMVGGIEALVQEADDVGLFFIGYDHAP